LKKFLSFPLAAPGNAKVTPPKDFDFCGHPKVRGCSEAKSRSEARTIGAGACSSEKEIVE
jgi:hypothetical protein